MQYKLSDLRNLPPTLDVVSGGAMLHCGRTSAYQRARDGTLPTIRVGHQLRVPTPKLLEMLGIDVEHLLDDVVDDEVQLEQQMNDDGNATGSGAPSTTRRDGAVER